MITLLNTSILTDFGQYFYIESTLESVKQILKDANNEFQSAVGHEATANVLTELLGIKVSVNRIQYKQSERDIAVIFKLNARIPEGVILTRQEIEEIGWSFGILQKVD